MKKPMKRKRISDAEFDAALRKALERRHQEKTGALPSEEKLQKEHHVPEKELQKERHFSEEDSQGEYHFSEEFDKKIMKMFEDYQGQFIPHTKNMIKKSWVLAAAFFVVVGITVSAGANRMARTHFAIGNRVDHSEVGYEVPDMALAPKEILEQREPEWGEEYEEIRKAENDATVIIRMSKKNTNIQIKFSQLIFSHAEPYMNTEYADLEVTLLELKNGRSAYYLTDSDELLLFWNDGEYYYTLQGNCKIEELLKLANSVKAG